MQWMRDWRIDFLEDPKDRMKEAKQPSQVKVEKQRKELLDFILKHRRVK